MPARPARLVSLYSSRDLSVAQDLERLFAVLERQGLIEIWSPRHIAAGAEIRSTMEQQIARADIILLLISADFLASESSWIDAALQQGRLTGARVIPVLVRSALLPPELESLQVLPRGGKPISGWSNRDDALLRVVEGVQTVLEYRPASDAPEGQPARTPGPPPVGAPATVPAEAHIVLEGPRFAANVAFLYPIDVIFRLNGPPDVTFVEPSQFPRLQAELGVMGSGLIVEGPSKVGKTTAIRKALATQRLPLPSLWLDGKAVGKEELERVLQGILGGESTGHLIVDDFHYLDDSLKRLLALRMKALADQERPAAKVTLVGINPVGSSLTQAVPDLSGRFRIVRMDRQKDVKIAELVFKGEQAANVRFERRDEIINEADGSFFIAQLLCHEALVQSGIHVTEEAQRVVTLGPADVLEAIQEELRARYDDDLRDFAAHDVRPPPSGASLALLWLLSQSRNGDVSIQEAIYRFPDLASSFEWLRASNLKRCFDHRASLARLFYYNRSAGTLSIEDPELKFYLRKLDWADLARRSGHVSVQFHPVDGPIFAPISRPGGDARPAAGAAESAGPVKGVATAVGASEVRLLHLSDLHFGNTDQATLWYAQLAADLRQQGCDQLDALVVSGDIGNLSIPEEYTAARLFLEHVMAGFGLSPRQVVIVPGNHDLNWTLSQDAYALHKRARYRGKLEEGAYIAHGTDIVEVRDEEAYRQRFLHFAEFYRQVKGENYPLDYEEQATLHDLRERGLLVLGLNSAWAIDHHFRARAGIHTGALARALLRLDAQRVGGAPAPTGTEGTSSPARLRMAVWHHPLTSSEPDHLEDAGFMQQLAVAGFRVALHGHVHRAESQRYRYDMSPDGRRIDLVAAGTFGAPVHQWVPGYPLQYNLLRVGAGALTVETRCREELNGAWRADPRWLQGPGKDPLPRYRIDL